MIHYWDRTHHFFDSRVELVIQFLGTHDLDYIHFTNNSILIHNLAGNCNALPPQNCLSVYSNLL